MEQRLPRILEEDKKASNWQQGSFAKKHEDKSRKGTQQTAFARGRRELRRLWGEGSTSC